MEDFKLFGFGGVTEGEAVPEIDKIEALSTALAGVRPAHLESSTSGAPLFSHHSVKLISMSA